MVYFTLWLIGGLGAEVDTVAKNRRFIFGLSLGILASILSSCVSPPTETVANVQVGQVAPGFKLLDLTGKQVSLDQFRGKIVMLDFWATWCGPCRMTMPLIESLQKEYADRLVLLAVNLQEPKETVLDYTRAQGIHSRVLLDEDGAVGEIYGAQSIPMQVLIDKQGVIRHIQMGYGSRTASQLRAQIDKLP
jgi:thiol-disulfide isomerase/thioredoxin